MEEIREGFYQDLEGNWQPDRRCGVDRRNRYHGHGDHNRRMFYRRKEDRQLERQDHDEVEAALDEFAQEHGGHL